MQVLASLDMEVAKFANVGVGLVSWKRELGLTALTVGHFRKISSLFQTGCSVATGSDCAERRKLVNTVWPKKNKFIRDI